MFRSNSIELYHEFLRVTIKFGLWWPLLPLGAVLGPLALLTSFNHGRLIPDARGERWIQVRFEFPSFFQYRDSIQLLAYEAQRVQSDMLTFSLARA